MELGHIDEGEYLIYVSIDWRPETPEEDRFFNFTSYGAPETSFTWSYYVDTNLLKHEDKYPDQPQLDILLQIFINKAQSGHPDIEKFVKKEEDGEQIVKFK